MASASQLPPEAGAVLEIVIDGLGIAAVEQAMRAGLHAAAQAGALSISAGNYGGSLGQYQIALKNFLDGAST